MNKRITFFGEFHNKGTGDSFLVTQEDHNNDTLGSFYFFSSTDIDAKKTINALSNSSRETYIEEIETKAIKNGILIEVFKGNVTIYFMGEEDSPENVLVLTPFDNAPKYVPSEKLKKLVLNTHLVVPVNNQAEAHLKSFFEDLNCFSQDAQINILHALRRPSLDDRLSLLERKFDHLKNGSKTAWNKKRNALGKKQTNKYGFTKIAIVSFVIVFIIGGIFVAHEYPLFNNFLKGTKEGQNISISPSDKIQEESKESPLAPDPEATATAPPKSDPIKKEGVPPKQEDKKDLPKTKETIIEETKVPEDPRTLEQLGIELINTIQGKVKIDAVDENIKKIFIKYFSKLAATKLTGDKIRAKAFTKNKSNPFSWGVLNLWAILHAQQEIKDQTFINSPWSSTKELLRKIEVPLNDVDKHLLGFMACNVKFYTKETHKNYNKPAIPWTDNNKEIIF